MGCVYSQDALVTRGASDLLSNPPPAPSTPCPTVRGCRTQAALSPRRRRGPCSSSSPICSLRPSRSDRFARWQATATRCALARSETGVLRDRTQSRKSRACSMYCPSPTAGLVVDRAVRARIALRGRHRPSARRPGGPPSRRAPVHRRHVRVRRHREARPRDAERPLRAVELHAVVRAAGRPTHSRIANDAVQRAALEQRVLRVGRLAVVLEANRPPTRRDRLGACRARGTSRRCRAGARRGWSSARRSSPRTSGSGRGRGSGCTSAPGPGRASGRSRDPAGGSPIGRAAEARHDVAERRHPHRHDLADVPLRGSVRGPADSACPIAAACRPARRACAARPRRCIHRPSRTNSVSGFST